MRTVRRLALFVLSAAALVMLPVIPATAGNFQQGFGSGSYHASYDFIPGAANVRLGGWGCSGGTARYWYTQLVKTSGSVSQGSSYSYPANGVLYQDSRAHYTAGGTSYYGRWYGQDSNLNNGYSAPCSGINYNW